MLGTSQCSEFAAEGSTRSPYYALHVLINMNRSLDPDQEVYSGCRLSPRRPVHVIELKVHLTVLHRILSLYYRPQQLGSQKEATTALS